MELPESAYECCIVCEHPAPPSPRRLYVIRGLERDRTAGGTNHVIDRQRTGEVVCSNCAERVQQIGLQAAMTQGALV